MSLAKDILAAIWKPVLGAGVILFALWRFSEARFEAGIRHCEALQAAADQAARDEVDTVIEDSAAIDSAADQEQTKNEQDYRQTITARDLRAAYQDGLAAGLAQRQSDSVAQAGADGGCLVRPYDPDDQLLGSARSLQSRLFGDRAGGDAGRSAAPLPRSAPPAELAGPAPD